MPHLTLAAGTWGQSVAFICCRSVYSGVCFHFPGVFFLHCCSGMRRRWGGEMAKWEKPFLPREAATSVGYMLLSVRFLLFSFSLSHAVEWKKGGSDKDAWMGFKGLRNRDGHAKCWTLDGKLKHFLSFLNSLFSLNGNMTKLSRH